MESRALSFGSVEDIRRNALQPLFRGFCYQVNETDC